MKRTKKGIVIASGTIVLWLVFAIVFPNFQRYDDPEFNRWHQIISFTISGMALICLGFGVFQIIKGRKEK